MKRILLLFTSLLLLVGMTLGLAGCKKKDKDDGEKSYTLDCTEFNSVAVYGEELSLSGLKLVESGGETVAVTSDMVSGVDTSSVGAKQLTVSYDGQTFTADYTVKFRIVYVVEGAETVQLVTDVSEVVVPETPDIVGKQFEMWSVQLPNVLTGNMRIDAMYKTLSGERENAYTWSGSGVINLSGYASAGASISADVTDADGNQLDASMVSVDQSAIRLNYTVGTFDVIIVSISGDGVMPKSWKIEKIAEPTLSFAGGTEAAGYILGSDMSSQKITSSATPVGFKYVAASDNGNVSVAAASGYLVVEPLKAGVSEITVKAVNATNELEYITLKHYAVVTPEVITIANDAVEYGIEDIWTVGRENAGSLPKLTVSGVSADMIGEGFLSNISFVTGSANVTVTDGVIALTGTQSTPEIVEIKAVFGYKGVSCESAAMKVRCVYNGVNVYSYSELWAETQKASPRPVVLQSNIKDFSPTNHTTMKSTYDLTYYENIGADAMEINVLMQFKNDVYGNGYEINAHNATLGTLDSTGKPTGLFQGPLNFVAMSQSGSSISVKGQDNIVFAVYDNVTLNNVILRSCELTAVDGKVDLTKLEYAGTTVEVLGDNVTIEYCRLENGRTVLRVFGDATDSEKAIHLNVKNTMLKSSREFIARIGSNRFVYDANTASPLLPGDTGSDYNAKKTYDSMSAEEKAAYDSKYINTFVTFENCVFEDAGIFAIAIDSHFAGEALKDGSGFVDGLLTGWKDLAKTSYGAKVTLKEDVRFYTWKPLDDIDSSTLMDNRFPEDNGFASINLNVKELVRRAASSSNYSNIIFNYNGVDYVHAGIAFFGGGKNYGVVENAITSAFNPKLQNYTIALSDESIGQGYLEQAAGTEPFYFLICNKDGQFTYQTQITMSNKYDCLKRKT